MVIAFLILCIKRELSRSAWLGSEGGFCMVLQRRLELLAYGLGNRCSILLSYWSIGVNGGNRTHYDLGHNQACIRSTSNTILAPPTGFEPVTKGLTVLYSTCWAKAEWVNGDYGRRSLSRKAPANRIYRRRYFPRAVHINCEYILDRISVIL